MVAFRGGARASTRTSAAPARAALRIGYLSTGEREQREVFLDALREGLREQGWVDGRNIVIDVRWVGADASRFPAAATELVRSGPSAIVSTCIPSTRAAKAAAPGTPVVMSIDGDPVEAKLVTSLARPGGNVTGAWTLFETMIPKWLELIRLAVPAARVVAVVSDPNNLTDEFHMSEMRDVAANMRLGIEEVKIRSRAEIVPALRGIDRAKVSAAVFVTDALLTSEIATIVPLAVDVGLPSIFGFSEFAEAGGLMSYGFSYRQYYRRVARYVDAVLRGAKPADLPVEQPATFEMVVNRTAAGRLKLALPAQLVLRADRLIG